MKKYILLFVMLSTSLMANEINVIVSGKPGGSFFARSQMYIESLQAKGYNVNVENIGNATQSAVAFKKTNLPTVMVYANNQAALNNLPHTENNFILLEYQDSLFLCGSKNINDIKKIAYSKSHPKSILTKILQDHGVPSAKMIPYRNSGAMLKAIMAGEVDAMINSQSKSLKYAKTNKGICHAQTSDKVVHGVKPFKTKEKVLPILHLTVIGKNLDQKSKEDVREISQNDKFKQWRAKRKILGIDDNFDQQLQIVMKNEGIWNIKK